MSGSHYQKLIIDVTGVDETTAVAIEGLMRVDAPTLDHLDIVSFRRMAKMAVAVFNGLDADTREFYLDGN